MAPSRAKVRAVARPLPMPSPGLWPTPTTMATLSFRRMSAYSWDRVLLQHFLVLGLVVHLGGRQYAHDGAVEGDRDHEIDHVLVGQFLLDLGEGGIGHGELAHHLARAAEYRLGERFELGGLALGLEEEVLDVVV